MGTLYVFQTGQTTWEAEQRLPSVAGAPLTMVRDGSGLLGLQWGAACDHDPTITRYVVYRGTLASLAGDLKINEVVDTPHMLVSMHMPKSVLGID